MSKKQIDVILSQWWDDSKNEKDPDVAMNRLFWNLIESSSESFYKSLEYKFQQMRGVLRFCLKNKDIETSDARVAISGWICDVLVA